ARRDRACEGGVRAVADRVSVGTRRGGGARRRNGDRRRARPRAPAGDSRQAAVAREPATERVSVADDRLNQRNWLQTVPDLVVECAEEWDLQLGEPYPPGDAGYARRVGLRDCQPAALKLVYPDRAWRQ